jgi:NAD(P)H-dependent flavin oxidoreductase YrpB (nitropropane dioxygenase family)
MRVCRRVAGCRIVDSRRSSRGSMVASEGDMTAFQELFGIQLPILQAPMAGVQGSALAIAVCEAGGLGALPCAMLTAEGMRAELATIAASTTNPLNVNFFCHLPRERDPDAERHWRELLAATSRRCGPVRTRAAVARCTAAELTRDLAIEWLATLQ